MKTSSAVGPSASRDPIIVQSAIESPFGQVILCQINKFFHQLTQNKTTELILSDLRRFTQQQSLFTMSILDRQSLRQKFVKKFQ